MAVVLFFCAAPQFREPAKRCRQNPDLRYPIQSDLVRSTQGKMIETLFNLPHSAERWEKNGFRHIGFFESFRGTGTTGRGVSSLAPLEGSRNTWANRNRREKIGIGEK